MSTTPTPSNPIATVIDDAEGAAITAVIKAAEAIAIADVPWLGLPVIKQLWEGAANYFGSLFSKVAQTGTTFAVIDVQTGVEQQQMSQALQNLIAAEQSGNASAIQTALQAYTVANAALIKDDGGTSSTQ
jgi:uncharacterized membrane protein YfbV (UPF0208 family)